MSPASHTQPLTARATPSGGVRASRGFFKVAAVIAVTILASAGAFAFVIAPRIRAEDRAQRLQEADAARATAGSVQPAEVVRTAAATYDRVVSPEIAASRFDPPPGPQPASALPQPARPAQRDVGRGQAPGDLETARASGLFAGEPHRAAPPPAAPPAPRPPVTFTEDYADVTLDRAPLRPLSPHLLQAGTIIPAALETAIDTDLAGVITARVTQTVFDTVTGRTVLIPQGARLIGRYEREVAPGQKRAFLVWQRILFANGRSITLGAMPGTDARGATGVADEVDYHSVRLARAIALAGAVTTIGERARDQRRGDERSLIASAGDAAAIEAAQTAGRLIDREMTVNPTIRIRAGAAVSVVLTRDVILTPYQEAAR